MKHLLTLKGAIIAAAVGMLLAGGVIFGTHAAFDVNITGNVTLTVTGDPIQILSADGATPINSGDALDFGTASLDFFGRGPVPVRGPFFVKNFSNGPVVVEVTGDLRDDIVPLFGPTVTDLKPAPGNAFTLAAPGTTGDTVRGFLGLRFLNPSAGSKQTTIIFRATETGDAVPTPIQAPPGMVSWWPGDGNASDIIDGNHGTLSGDATSTADGMVGQAFSFDGAGDSVVVGHDPSLILNHFTLDAWVKPGRLPGSTHQGIITKNATPSRPPSLWLFGDKVQVWFDPDGHPAATSTTGLTLDTWHHVAATYDGSAVKIYINGVLDISTPKSSVPATNTQPLLFGAGRDNNQFFFQGLIDEVEVFNRALSAAEIRAIFEAGSAGEEEACIGSNP